MNQNRRNDLCKLRSECDLNDPLDRAEIKTQLYFTVDQIISDLPKSQRLFYRDLFGGNLNQADVAAMYGITPQAATNRLTKLKKTVAKRLQQEYGLEKEDILTRLLTCIVL